MKYPFNLSRTVCLLALPGWLAAAEPAAVKHVESTDFAIRDHQLFVGLDLFVADQGESLPVVTIENDTLWVETAPGVIEPRSIEQGFRWRKEAKVAPVAVELSELKNTPVLSVVANPEFERESQQASLMEYLTTRQAMADRELRYLDAKIKNAGGEGGGQATAQEMTAKAFAGIADSSTQLQRYQTQVRREQGGFDGNAANFDGLVHTFTVSAPQPIADAYAVILVRIRDKEDQLLDYNYTRAIGPIGPDPREISVSQFDFPAGFELLNTEIYLYSRGHELATSQSERRVPLTADEARQFAVELRRAETREDSAPAAVVWALAPAALRAAEDPAPFDHPVTVHVDADGNYAGIDPAANAVVPPQVRNVVESLVYLPPVEGGEAVAGRLVVNPADYFGR